MIVEVGFGVTTAGGGVGELIVELGFGVTTVGKADGTGRVTDGEEKQADKTIIIKNMIA
jgi:hypothetical protein